MVKLPDASEAPEIDFRRVLFVGWGGPDGVSHYRTILPARSLGAEWVIFDMRGKPVCGEGVNKNHDIVIVQNCWEKWQVDMIDRMRAGGAKVVANVDDWIKTIGKMDRSHGEAEFFRRNTTLKQHYRFLSDTDGAIVATPWLADRLLRHQKYVATARNGLDLDRYGTWADVERDQGFIIGWAGGTGHREAVASLVSPVSAILRDYDNVSMWIVGEELSSLFPAGVRDKVHQRPWSDMYMYPKDLACFDVNLAPALENDFYKAKSQLRYYEALAVGNPTIGHPMYTEIIPEVTGIHASSPVQWAEGIIELIEDPEKLDAMREQCWKERENVSIKVRRQEWIDALRYLKLQWDHD